MTALYRQRVGDREGPRVLWLHGALVSGWMWTPQLEALPWYDSLVVDLPGHGQSHGAEWISFEDTADAILGLMDEEGFGAPVNLVGMSLGAIVGLHLLSRDPDRFRKAALTGVAARPLKRVMTWANLAVGALTQLPGAEGLVGRALQLPPEAREGFQEAGLALDRRSFFRINDQLLDDFLPPDLGALRQPTLLLAGEKEAALILESQRLLHEALPDSKARIAPGCHHAWSGEQPALFSETIDHWIKNLALPAALRPI
jgi:pimeloyl-ACP methyl ester carboxylesterase